MRERLQQPAGIAAARDALEDREPARALDLLIAEWRRRPAPEIAEAIEAIAPRAAGGRTPPTGKTPKERGAAWEAAAAAREPGLLGPLLDSLTETKGCAETQARIDLLVDGGTDPRLATRIGDLIERPVYNASVSRTNVFWKRIFALLPLLGDPRLLVRARRWPEAWRGNHELNPPEVEALERRLATALPALERARAVPPILDEAERALLATMASRPAELPGAAARATEEELVAAVWADPIRDEPRLVYADWLVERGDPRSQSWTAERNGESWVGGIAPSHLAWAWSAPATAKLRQLELVAPLARLPDWLDALAPSSVERLVLSSAGEAYWAEGWRLLVERDGAGRLARFTALSSARGGATGMAASIFRAGADALTAGLEALPADAAVELALRAHDDALRALPPGWRRRLDAALRRQTRAAPPKLASPTSSDRELA